MSIEKLFYTYDEIADLFSVRTQTVRNWKAQGLFKIIGYRRLGKWKRIAVVDANEVKLLIKKRFQL